jgi:translation initiation factor IF-2
LATAATSKIKIFQVAKEVGVDSRVVVAKLIAEGIPEAEKMNYQTTIPVGLAVTIKEWFSTDASLPHTAVETGEKVDVEKAKATKRPSRAKAKPKTEESDAGEKTGTGSVPTAQASPTASAAAAAPAAPAPEVKAPVARPGAKAQVAPQTDAHVKATAYTPPPAPVAPPSRSASAPPEHRHAAHAPSAPPERGHAPPHRPGEGSPPPLRPAGPPPSRPAQPPPSRSVTPAPMNVPSRPNVVTPAGPRLQVVTPVKLSGPKVVRVEAPDHVEAPRPRGPRGPSSGPGGPRTGGGAGTGEDDRGRSPRRKDGGGAGAAAAAAKRSSGLGVPERRRGRSDSEWTGSTQGIFSEQDLIEREARLARAGGLGLKKRKQELARVGQSGAAQAESEGKVRIAAPFTIKELSAATGVKGADVVKKLFLQGVMATINSAIDPAKAVELMMDFDIELEVTEQKTAEETVSDTFVNREAKDLRSRGPVVTILGHVDHGKTSLLDKIRNANVAAGEAGGITQKTSAFVSEVEVEGQKKQVVFLDTPGHEAFTGMRARGAKITDVVVLVVSAPEGVMPQTIESINHAKAAKVPIVVALNKIDRPDATDQQVQKTLGQLAAADLNVVEWGGSVECVKVSALTGKGIPELLQILDLQASVLELKADFGGPAQGTVVEAKVEEGRGAVANILVQQGKLEVGDFIVMGRAFGRVRDITDDKGKRVKTVYPPMPVQVSGIDMVCDAGDKFYVTDSLKKAEEAAEQRRQRERHAALAQPKLTLDSLFSQMQQTQGQEQEVKEIKIVLKTDQQGTVDVLKMECEKIKTAEVRVRVLHAAVGGITEADIGLADASKAIVIGFNVIPSGKARQMAEHKGIEIRTYQVIYDITDDLRKAAEGLLAPEVREEVLGHADVRQVFKVSKVGNIAGCYVTDGTVARDALIRVTRNGVVVEHDRKLSQLKRMKDDAKEVRAGLECGMKIDGYDDIKEGDVLECYKKVEVKRTL